MSRLQFLAEIVVYDTIHLITRTLRYASGNGFVTEPSETPANTVYRARLQQPALLSRDLFNAGTTSGRSRVGYGDLVLLNSDGALDDFINYAVDGRDITIRLGTEGAAYPSGFPPVFVGTMLYADINQKSVTIKMRDRQAALDVPIQPTKYAGTNTGGAGLEGLPEDIQGQPKPLTFGVALNVPAVPVNPARLIYQVNDGAVESVDAVYDRGIPLQTGRQWTSAGGAPLSGPVYALGYGLGFVLGAESGTGKIYRSANHGQTWSFSATLAGPPTRIAYDGVGLVGVVVNDRVYSSTDAVIFTDRGAIGAFYSLLYSSRLALWIAGGNGGLLKTSPDLITWTTQSAFTTDTISTLVDGPDCVVAATNLGWIYSADDGITYTERAAAIGGGFLYDGCYGNSQFVLVGGVVATSPDGHIWLRSPAPSSPSSLLAVVCAGSFFAAGSTTDTVYSSVGAQSWTSLVVPAAWGGLAPLSLATDGTHITGGTATGRMAYTQSIDYANATELQDDTLAPNAGEYTACPSAGHFRLGSSPAGTITADITEGATSADRTTAQVFKRVLEFAGFTSGDYDAGDLTTLDAADSSEIGLFIDSETNVSAVLDQIAGTVGASWSPDKLGVFRLTQLLAPTGSPVMSFTANDLLVPLERQASSDPGRGVPSYRSILRYAQNYTVQTTDLAAGVSDARRAIVGQPWRSVNATDSAVQTAHLLAQQTDEETRYATAAGAQAEADRRQALRGVARAFYTLVVQLTENTGALDLSDVIALAHARFGLSGGALFRVMGTTVDATSRRVALRVWG